MNDLIQADSFLICLYFLRYKARQLLKKIDECGLSLYNKYNYAYIFLRKGMVVL